jgi:hypothetical protein
MDVGLSTVRKARARHRHELRTLTYVTLDQANGGIIRNLNHEGMAVQLATPVLPQQQMRVRFELRHPRLRVETRGEVAWATFSGQCGVRFLDLPPRTARQIDEWIFSNLLEGIPHSAFGLPADDGDGLMVSSGPVKVIELPLRPESDRGREPLVALGQQLAAIHQQMPALDWLSQPLSGRGLAWTVNVLAVVAALLLFVMIFLSVAGELPRWPYALAGAAAIVVAGLYWGFFKLFGGSSPGVRLARLAGYEMEEEEAEARFR